MKLPGSQDPVRQLAEKFQQASNQVQEVVSNVHTTMSNLQSYWVGVEYERIFREYSQWNSRMTRDVQLLSQIKTELNEIADVFEEAGRREVDE